MPEVFEEKTKWRLDWVEAPEEGRWESNYPSAVHNMKDIRRQVNDHIMKDWVGVMEVEAAKEKFGKTMTISSQGAVPKGVDTEEVRTVHDGTNNVQLNNRIRVRDKVRYPTADDLEAVLREVSHRKPLLRFAIVFDIECAHRNVPIIEDDWGCLCFRLDHTMGKGKVYYHKVGAYGIGSAAY